MIYKIKPKGFAPKFEVVSCFVEFDEEILLLHRQSHKSQGNTWGVPAGKVEQHEEAQRAIIRELREETGIIARPRQMSYFLKLFVQYTEYGFIYHIFHLPLKKKPDVVICDAEHKAYNWLKPREALGVELIQDLDSCIKLFYRI